MSKQLKLNAAPLLLFAAIWSAPTPAQQATLQERYDHATACSAYAMIKTEDYPETIHVYKENQPAETGAAKRRADEGMRWTNRGWFASSVGAVLFEQIHGRPSRNKDTMDEKANWMKILNNANALQKEVVHTKCKPLFEDADKFCKENICVDKVR